jgi:hypothetical protein
MSDVTKITVNGREYDSVDHMPPEVREMYLQAMATLRESGTQNVPGFIKKNIFSTVKESFTYNGREYKSRDEMPPEVRALFDNIPELPLDVKDSKISDVKIVTDRTITPGRRTDTMWGLSDDRPERDPKVAWMLVMVLSAVIIVLLFLLYLAGVHHKSG